jgi:hypothetical protein
MEQIVIQVRDKKNAQNLVDYLKSLDFIEKISRANYPLSVPAVKHRKQDFFAMAGLWAGRDVSLDTIRKKAWPERT